MELLILLPEKTQKTVREAGSEAEDVVKQYICKYFDILEFPEPKCGDASSSLAFLRWFYANKPDFGDYGAVSPPASPNHEFADPSIKALFEQLREQLRDDDKSFDQGADGGDDLQISRATSNRAPSVRMRSQVVYGTLDHLRAEHDLLQREFAALRQYGDCEREEAAKQREELVAQLEGYKQRVAEFDTQLCYLNAKLRDSDEECVKLRYQLETRVVELSGAAEQLKLYFAQELERQRKEYADAVLERDSRLERAGEREEALKSRLELEKANIRAIYYQIAASQHYIFELAAHCRAAREQFMLQLKSGSEGLSQRIYLQVEQFKRAEAALRAVTNGEREKHQAERYLSESYKKRLEESLHERDGQAENLRRARAELTEVKLQLDEAKSEEKRQRNRAEVAEARFNRCSVTEQALREDVDALDSRLRGSDALITTLRATQARLLKQLQDCRRLYADLNAAIQQGNPETHVFVYQYTDEELYSGDIAYLRAALEARQIKVSGSAITAISDVLSAATQYFAESEPLYPKLEQLRKYLEDLRRRSVEDAAKAVEQEQRCTEVEKRAAAYRLYIADLRAWKQELLGIQTYNVVSASVHADSRSEANPEDLRVLKQENEALTRRLCELLKNTESASAQTRRAQDAQLVFNDLCVSSRAEERFIATSALEAAVRERDAEVQRLRKEIMEYQEGFCAADPTLQSLQARFQEAEAEIARLRTENTELRYRQREDEKKSASQHQEQLSKSWHDASEQFTQQNKFIQQVTGELREAEQRLLDLNREMHVQQRDAEKRAEEAHRRAQGDIDALEARLRASEDARKQLEEQRQQWRSESQLSRENKALERENAYLRAELAAAGELQNQSRASMLEDAHAADALERQVQYLQERLREQESLLHARDGATAVVERSRHKQEVMRLQRELEYARTHVDPSVEAELRQFQEIKATLTQLVPNAQTPHDRLFALVEAATTRVAAVFKYIALLCSNNAALCTELGAQVTDDLMIDILRCLAAHFHYTEQIYAAAAAGGYMNDMVVQLGTAQKQLRTQLLE